MMFALAKHAEKTWRKIDGFNNIAQVLDGVVYTDGELKNGGIIQPTKGSLLYC